MNLDLHDTQRRLVEALRVHSTQTPVTVSGWYVFDALGVTGLLTQDGLDRPALALLDWCLVLEELGADGRDLHLIRSVRTFLDVFVGQRPDRGRAREAFTTWASQVRADPTDAELFKKRTADGGSVTWSTVGCSPALCGVSDVQLEATEAVVVENRDLVACAAYAIGVGRCCLELAQERAAERVIAGRRLIEFQGVSHRLAEAAVKLACARVAVWLAASTEDEGSPAGFRAATAAAASVSASLDCAHEVVQTFGAAGTSDPTVVALYTTAYEMAGLCGSPGHLYRSAAAQRAAHIRHDALSGR